MKGLAITAVTAVQKRHSQFANDRLPFIAFTSFHVDRG
jgi:hypothetical protein